MNRAMNIQKAVGDMNIELLDMMVWVSLLSFRLFE